MSLQSILVEKVEAELAEAERLFADKNKELAAIDLILKDTNAKIKEMKDVLKALKTIK